jgi:hypothetical protein
MRQTSGYMHRVWSEGEGLLARGRYVAARGLLERAAGLAWRAREARALARIHLPLLEARRQMRYQAVEGRIVIGGRDRAAVSRDRRQFEEAPAGTFLLCDSRGRGPRLAGAVEATARRTGRCLEALLLVRHGNRTRLASPRDPTFAAGLPVTWTRDATSAIEPSTDPALVVPLPPVGVYDGKAAGLGALARETLLLAWEALALRWQSRHLPAGGAGPWEELAWLRGALRIDPACEPITMRLIAVAEAVARGKP